MIVNGWKLYAHPLFLFELESLLIKVETLQLKYPNSYKDKNSSKRLTAIFKLITKNIPQDPTSIIFRQGNTLGKDNKHWFRAKFFQQYRLFFRYHEYEKIIIYAWVNDENCKRKYNSKTDAYKVFETMFNSGNPPGNWDKLLSEVKETSVRLNEILSSKE